MHKLAIILLSLMLILVTGGIGAPVYGQAIPTPSPSAQSVIGEVTEAAQTLGTVTVVILAVLAILVLIVVFFVIAVWRLGTPLVTTVQRLIETVRSLSDARDRRDLDDDARKLAQVALLERYKALLENISTKPDDEQRTNTAAQKVVTDVNAHTTATLKPVDDKLQKVATTLDEVKKEMVTKTVLDGAINPLVEKIDAALRVIHDLQEPPAPAPETARAESGTLSEVDTKQE